MTNMGELWFQTGLIFSTDVRQFGRVYGICYVIRPVMSGPLPADHTLTGYDTTSSFFGMDKNSS